jgi:hypothetical protein
MRLGFSVTRRVLAPLAVAAASALLSACSAPTVFPGLFDEPPPRNEATLNPDQVKQAVDGLVSDRNRLCSEAMANAGRGATPPDCTAQTAATAGAAAKP